MSTGKEMINYKIGDIWWLCNCYGHIKTIINHMKYQILRQYKDLITLVVNFYTSKATDPALNFLKIKN